MLFNPPAQTVKPCISINEKRLRKRLQLLQCCGREVMDAVKKGVNFHPVKRRTEDAIRRERMIAHVIRSNEYIRIGRVIAKAMGKGDIVIIDMGRMTIPRFKCIKAVAAITGRVVTLTRVGRASAVLRKTSVPIPRVPAMWVRVIDDGAYGLPFTNPYIKKHVRNVRSKRPAPEKRAAV